MQTVGDLRKSLERWLREKIDKDLALDAIGDAIESLGETLTLQSLSSSLGGPVTLSIASGAERVSLASVADPTVVASLSASGVVTNLLADYWDVRYTLVTESGTETLESPKSVIQRTLNNSIRVASAVLGTPGGTAYPSGVVGYNVYAGKSDASSNASTRRAKQNEEPVPIGQSWDEPSDAGMQEFPDRPTPPLENTTADDLVAIAAMELQDQGGNWRRWDPIQITSFLAESYGFSPSGYGSYAFDLINQRVLELRPTAGVAMSPRYFYIKKQRRPRYDAAILPFANVAREEFLRAYALARICRSIGEREQAKDYALEAEDRRRKIADSLSLGELFKKTRVKPIFGGGNAIRAIGSGGSQVQFVDGETPSGTIDGVNATFTLQYAPAPSTSLVLVRNGVTQANDVAYTLTGNVITFLGGYIPQVGDILRASYRR